MPTEEPQKEELILVLRCRNCGDTFPAHVGDAPLCPTCAGEEHDEAHEPLL
jgi:predicted Zn-ribbon and HTH transcriptional regulator